MTDKLKTDVVIVGGGPAGSASALHLLQRGITPVIVERESFPRFHIGESMTGEAGGLVRDLGFEDQMLFVVRDGPGIWYFREDHPGVRHL